MGGVQYNVLVQTPQYLIDSINSLQNQPVVPSSALVPGGAFSPQAQLLGSVATLDRGVSAANITHYNPRPTFDVLAGVLGMDLNSVANGVRNIVARERKSLPTGTQINIRGQVQSMQTSFQGLSYGLIFAIILVYLLLVINFQSWLDPLIILMALPGALAGILWMLFVTQTTINVPSLMEMCIRDRLYAWGISPSDVSNVIGAQNLILPAGDAKIGTQEYPVVLNSSPIKADDLNDLPVKTFNGTPVYIKDVAHVRRCV